MRAPQQACANSDIETQEQQLRQELETAFATIALTIEELNDRYPIFFFPVRIETGFSNTTNQYSLRFKKILIMDVKSLLTLNKSQTRFQDLLNSHH